MSGAHPKVLERLNKTNLTHTEGYGNDEFTTCARQRVLEECGLENNGEVFFVTGGTQANAVVIDRLLGRNDGVIAADPYRRA